MKEEGRDGKGENGEKLGRRVDPQSREEYYYKMVRSNWNHKTRSHVLISLLQATNKTLQDHILAKSPSPFHLNFYIDRAELLSVTIFQNCVPN